MRRKCYLLVNVLCAAAVVALVAMITTTVCRYCLTENVGTTDQTEPHVKQSWYSASTLEYEAQERPAQNPTYSSDIIVVNATTTQIETDEKINLSDGDMNALMRIAMAEAEGEDTKGKAMVMMVVLNRSNTNGFPNTIEGVILQEHNGTHQFSVTARGGRYWKVNPDDECTEALKMILNGWDESQGALYFESCSDPDNWHSRNLEFLFQYGAHRFYK